MSRYDGLIIPRSYSEYINKTDAATISQALQLGGVLAQQVSAGNNAAVTSNAVNGALANYETIAKSGDRYTFSASIVYGYITNASQHLFFFIPTQKSFYGKVINFETLRLIIRQNGYYLFPKESATASNNEVDLLDTEKYSVTITQSEAMMNGIRLQVVAPSWYRQSSTTKATNNETFTALLSSCNFTVN